MSAYLPALIWSLSGMVCHVIAKRRLVKNTNALAVLVTFMGPFAIPLVLAASRRKLARI